MKKILLFILLLPFLAVSQTTNFSFTNRPFSDPEINAVGRGAQHWQGIFWDNSQAPQVPSGTNESGAKLGYIRFNWYEMESATQGVYTLTGSYPAMEWWFRYYMDRGQAIGFGSVMSVCDGCDAVLDGGRAAYPAYLHTLMQAEATNSKDWKSSGGVWVPNWNSENYLSRFEALLDTISNFINTKSYTPSTGPWAGRTIAYKDVISYVDIRGYGNFGEWHNYPYWGEVPTGRTATSTSLKRIIDAHKNKFPNYQLIALAGGYDGGNASVMPADVSDYLLRQTNNYGPYGWRRDNVGDAGMDAILVNNPYSFSGRTFDTAIANRWKYAPTTGEPSLDQSPYTDIAREVRLYHYMGYGNGNYGGGYAASTVNRDSTNNYFKASGYRYNLNAGYMTTSPARNTNFTISLSIKNVGVAPIYEKRYRLKYVIRNSGGTAIWTGYSTFKPYLFLPATSDSVVTDVFNLGNIAPSTGNTLEAMFEDSLGVLDPLDIGISSPTRNSNGSYTLRSAITTIESGGNVAPTANAGSDQSITLPTSSVTLSGSGTDPDGTITTYAWTQIGGTSVTITSPSSASTSITGFSVAGTYTFRLTVTDNNGATGTDDIIVTVNAAPSGGTNTLPIIQLTNSSSGTGTSVNTLTGVTAGALLVLTVAQPDDIATPNASISSTPSLTWTKRVDAEAASSGNVEIYTAVFTAGGSITVNSSWGVSILSSVLYSVTNYNTSSPFGGTGSATIQTSPSINVTTTTDSSIIFCAISDWAAINGSGRVYRSTPVTESFYATSAGVYTTYHFYKVANTVGVYTLGTTTPTGQASGIVGLEIKGAIATIPLQRIKTRLRFKPN